MNGKITLIIAVVLILVGNLSADTQINSNSSDLQLFPKVAHTEGGRFLFTWVSNHAGQAFEIYSRSTNSSLTPSGSDATLSVPFSARDGHRLHAEIIPSIKSSTNDTGAIVAWVNHFDQKVYARRINSNGTLDDQWPIAMNELIVHPAAFMTPPEMCSDGAGGAIFDKILINDIIVSAVLKGYNKHQLNPFVGF